MKKHFIALITTTVVVGTMLSGCTSDQPANTPTSDAEQSQTPVAKEQVLRFNLTTEPATTDPGLSKDLFSGTIIRATFDGLTRIGADGKAKESVADKISVSADGLTYTFTLRDTTWSNGDPLTAHDFVYSWKRVLNPQTGSEFAHQLFPIKNAEKYHGGQAKAEDVGVKALDDKTLEVTLENPAPYFLELTAFYTYYPVHQKTVEANENWANEAATHIGNGPFKISAWEHKSRITLVKNENYWDKDSVTLDKIECSMIEDNNTEHSMFDNDELDWAGSPTSSLPTDAIPVLKDSGKLISKPISGIYWYKFNTERVPFNNVKIRKAFAYAINREEIVKNVTQGGEQVALGILPSSMQLSPDGYFKDGDTETAKKLFAEGMQELGLTKLPVLELSYNTSGTHKKVAEAIQDQWKKALGIEVKLQNKEAKVHLQDLHTGNYEVARIGYLADFNDPINLLGQYKEKDGGSNDTRWENATYKELLTASDREMNPDKRKELLKQAESILMEEMPITPIYYLSMSYVKKDDLDGVIFDSLGFIDFKWAYRK